MTEEQRLKRVLQWGILLLLFFVPLAYFPLCYDRYNGVKESFTLMVFAVMLFSAGCYLLFNRVVSFRRTAMDFPLAAFIAVCFLSLLFSVNPYEGMMRTFWFCALGLAFLSTHLVFRKSEEILFAFLIISLSGFLVCGYGLFLFFIHKKWFIATLGVPNFASQYLLFVMPVSVGLVFLDNPLAKRYRTFLAACFLLSYYSFILTLVKGAWIGFFISIFAAFYFLKDRFKLESAAAGTKKWAGTILLGVVFFTVLSVYTDKPSPKRGVTTTKEFQQMMDVQSPTAGIRTRFTFYKDTLSMIRDYFITGVGAGNFAFIYPEYRTLKEDIHGYHERLTRVHNDYLQIFAEMGVAGFAIFFWIIFIYFRRFLRWAVHQSHTAAYNENLLVFALFSGIVATLVQSLFDFNLYNPVSSLYFFVFLGASFSLFGDANKQSLSLKESHRMALAVMAFSFSAAFFYFPARFLVSEYWKKQGAVAHLLKQYNAAHINYSKAIKANLFDFETYGLASENAFAQKKYKDALDFINHALSYSPKDYQFLNFRGKAYFAMHEYLKAYNDFQTALRIYDFSIPHYNLGLLYETYGQIGHALKEYKLCAERNPSYSPAYYKLGILYGMGGFPARALSYFKKAEIEYRDDADFHYNMALALMETGKTSRALQALKKSVSLSPGNKTYKVVYEKWSGKEGMSAVPAQAGKNIK